ncbi:MAG TPA: response regulator [Flavisolibacter sp.]|nr:response regulator [Flavisolibacter sp.]
MEGYLNIEAKRTTVFTSQKILLLDDNRDLLQIVQIILKGQGYETILASSIEEAALKIKIHKPVLILMDVCLSDQDGYRFCSQLKNDPDTGGIRVIMMSGEDCNQTMISFAHADDFMQKPFDYNDLIGRVQKHYHEAERVTVH